MFKEWKARRKKRRDTEAYIRGFEWAMSEIFIARRTVKYVKNTIGYSNDQFDRGAIFATRLVSTGFKDDTYEQF